MSTARIFNRLIFGKQTRGARVEAFTPLEHHADEEAEKAANAYASRRAMSEALYFYREARRRESWQARQAMTEQASASTSHTWNPTRPARRSVTG